VTTFRMRLRTASERREVFQVPGPQAGEPG
jgi:hypothetical protein